MAGIADDFTAVHKASDAIWQQVFAVNVDGLFRLMRAVVPAMLEAGGGSIVNVASEPHCAATPPESRTPPPSTPSSASPAAPPSCTDPTGSVSTPWRPGGVATGMTPTRASEFGGSRTDPFLSLIPSVATAEQLAASITFLLSDDGVNINGAVLPADGGWSVQ